MDSPNPTKASTERRLTPAVLLATGLGVGLIRIAPGTFGALWGLPLAWGIGHFSPAWQAAIILILGLAGIPLCTRAAKDLGGRKDPGAVVYDEITTLPITFFLVPLNSLWVTALGFLLHRVFDVLKPPPARQLERLPAGLGIMADDWAAGLYSCAALHLVLLTGWIPI